MATNSTTSFKKSDFMNAIQLVEKLNKPAEEIYNVLLHEYKKGTVIMVGNTPRPMVMVDRTKHVALTNPKRLQLHPLAIPKIKEILEQKGK